MKQLLATSFLVAVLVCLTGVDAQGRRGPFGRGGRQRPNGENYSFFADLGDGVVVKVGAFAPNNRNVVFVRSFDRALREQNFTRAGTFYDFSGATPVFAILRGRASCLVGDTTLTYTDVTSDLQNQNATTVNITQEVTLDGTSDPLTRDDARALMEANPGLRFACGFRPVVRLTAGAAAATNEGTVDIKVLTFDSIMTVTVPTPPARPERPAGRGGAGGGRGGAGGRRGGAGGRRGGAGGRRGGAGGRRG